MTFKKSSIKLHSMINTFCEIYSSGCLKYAFMCFVIDFYSLYSAVIVFVPTSEDSQELSYLFYIHCFILEVPSLGREFYLLPTLGGEFHSLQQCR